ncbi:nucleotidyltransferase [Thalassobacillus pellis]|uniref:nucleotidyltransferase n=1 Tax=Thalassobacillus pellis TaxID=748008 RepID=UPI001961F2FF|nr:nucleotidyltransferase [Thalassobacillus pellis]MBM7552869.1 putative nucleotidyltransferase [Thalassobacillus pellis]
MKTCGLIVEYNPFHNGHLHHLEQSKYTSGADCMVAVMSGQFLQRGEPAIMDKWHRTEAALLAGADLVVELPHLFAVEHSDLFSKGAILTLKELGVDHVCFGSEHGNIDSFIKAAETYNLNKEAFDEKLKQELSEGLSFPEAARSAYRMIGLTEGEVDLSQPNNILGFGYVKQVLKYAPSIQPLTIQRVKNAYHDEEITGKIASATSIRKELLHHNTISEPAGLSFPDTTRQILNNYRHQTGLWHSWEKYFPFLQYKVLTMTHEELAAIHSVDEGLQYRLKNVIKDVEDFHSLMEAMKTKRYTWTRLQRMFVHILCNTKKDTARGLLEKDRLPYVRILGMSKTGQKYLRKIKKHMEVPMINQAQQLDNPLLALDERSSDAYYSVLPSGVKHKFLHQELQPPIQLPSLQT